jgi:Ribonuclease G/E
MLRLARWSDRGARARWGEVYAARVRRIDPQRRGLFLDLGLRGQEGFAPFASKAPRVTEGAGVVAAVAREAARGKNPVVKLLDAPFPGGAPRLLETHECDAGLEDCPAAPRDVRARIDALIENCLSKTAPIPGGGMLTIEPTAALIAIDVDAAGRDGPRDGEAFALDLGRAAIKEVARQIRLRNLGGIGAIDLPALQRKENQAALTQAFRDVVRADPWGVQAAHLSRFGVLEFSRGQLRAPLHETVCDAAGAPSAETIALAGLRAIETAANAARGRRVVARLCAPAYDWLAQDIIAWRAALDQRVGGVWKLEREAAMSGYEARVDG